MVEVDGRRSLDVLARETRETRVRVNEIGLRGWLAFSAIECQKAALVTAALSWRGWWSRISYRQDISLLTALQLTTASDLDQQRQDAAYRRDATQQDYQARHRLSSSATASANATRQPHTAMP
jgi:hypothetical protein